MAIKHLDYRAIPRTRRREQAARATAKMREMLQLNPAMTQEQRDAVEARIKHLESWVDGSLEPQPAPLMVAPAEPPAEPEHHEVVVEEELGIDEG